MVLRRFGIFDQNKVTWWRHHQHWLWRKIHMTSDDCHVLILLYIHLIPQIRIPSYLRGQKFINKHKLSLHSIFESLSHCTTGITRTDQLEKNGKNEKVKPKKLNRLQKFIFANIATESNSFYNWKAFFGLSFYNRKNKSVLISVRVGPWLLRYCGVMLTMKGNFKRC